MIYNMEGRLESIEKKTSALENKINISIDALENKIKELEQLIVAIDDDYYEIRKEMLKKLSSISPYIEEIKQIGNWKKEVMGEVNELEKAVKKMGKSMIRFHEELDMIKKVLRIK